MNTFNHYPKLPGFIQDRLNVITSDILESTQNGKHLVLGKRPVDGDIFLQSNDYLSLSNEPEIIQEHIRSLDENAYSPVMSGVFLQDNDSKPPLELALANYLHFDSCLVVQSGWSANTCLLQAICNPNTPVYIDFLAHMSLWEGARIVGAQPIPFMHNNVRHLKRMIRQHGPGIIAVDSVYSTIGTVAPLKEIVDVAKENGCAVLVDESHSLGTHGKHGEGLVHALGLSKRVDFITASLAKTFAYRAGAIWCNNRTNDVLPFIAYPAIFSSAMLPHELDRLSKTLEVIKRSDKERRHLQDMAKYLTIELKRIGFTIRSESQIIALETGDEANTEKVRDFLEERGVFGAIFCRPAAPANKNIIRFSLHAKLQQSQLDHVIEVCREAFDQPELSFI